MILKTKIGFVVGGFMAISLITVAGDLSQDEQMVDKQVQKHDHIFDTIRAEEDRTCLRSTLFSAYWDLRQCRGAKETCDKKVDDLNNKFQVTTQKLIDAKDDLLAAQKQIADQKLQNADLKLQNAGLKFDLNATSRLLGSCTTSLQKLSVRRYIEYVEKNSFPPWLLNNDMDRYERWLFASYFLKGENMDQIRKLWKESCNMNEECTYEALAGAMHSLYENISDAEAHGEHDLAPKPKQAELQSACELVAGDDAAKQLACKTAWTIKIRYSINAAGDAPTKTRCIFYGKILCSNLNMAQEQLGQLFSAKNKQSDEDDVKFCEVQYEVVDILRHPSKKKTSSSKKNYIGFRANCSKAVTPEKFKSYVMGEKGMVNSNQIKQRDNQQATMHIYEDPRNAPTQLTTTTASTQKPVP